MQAEVDRAIDTMWKRYSEPLTLADLADAAILSRFYFSRIFRMLTGTSPGRFLAAVRLHKAKNLLLETSMTVTDISYQVGYNSLGTFTSRFTRSVGISPARYRLLSHSGIPMVSIPMPRDPGRGGSISGSLHLPTTDTPVRTYIGVFESMIVQGQPVACDILDSPGEYRLTGIPDGQWFIRAVAVANGNVDLRPWDRKPLFVSPREWAAPSGQPTVVDLYMRPIRPIDLPVLLALPELDCEVLPQFVPEPSAT
jgi:AraC-like DNA-binding protein